MIYKLHAMIPTDWYDEVGYFAFCPELDGCFTQGDSYTEVVENIEDRIGDGEGVSQGGEMGISNMDLGVCIFTIEGINNA